MTGTSTNLPLRLPHLTHQPEPQPKPQPKPNILPLLILQQRSLFKTLSNGFAKLQGLLDDSDGPAEQGLEKVSLELGELKDNVRAIRCRMDAFIGMAGEAGCIDLVETEELEEGAVSPLILPSRRTGKPDMNVPRNFSRPFPRISDVSVQRQGYDCERDAAVTTMRSHGDMGPKTRCRDPEHNQTSTMPTHQTPSLTTPLAQGDGKTLTAQPRVSVLIDSPLEGSNIRKQVKRASRVRDPHFNEVRRISVLKKGVIRTTYYRTEPVNTGVVAAGEDGNPLSSENSDTQFVERIGRIWRMIKRGRKFLGWKSGGRRKRW
ncbi:hypothetical protein B9Z19DRAFT_1127602 [Tuber borchii]|uniref:Uncharacterized protein n=1 Tax=Tuber borchii TaxID=42251 RepID=A0A2T6ZQY0_TUBBO|nr:hypothetical protein B9Z19DRAFT_1127602 [Tuber borchii]